MTHALKASAARPPVYPSDLTPEIQRALRALADVESRFEADLEGLERWSGPSPLKQRLLAHFTARHARDREPLVQRLADLQREMTAAMMFVRVTPH